jgi:serine/threonine protein kinase
MAARAAGLMLRLALPAFRGSLQEWAVLSPVRMPTPEPDPAPWRSVEVLKHDALGRVERVVDAGGRTAVRRLASGCRIPGSAFVARLLLARERRALQQLVGLADVPQLLDHGRGWLVRSWFDGLPLHRAGTLPRDFFAQVSALLASVHARGVVHNDLHKEPNVLVQPDGRPALVDFQLASVHRGGPRQRSRMREDQRHVDKHAQRYERRGQRPPAAESLRRSWVARLWSALGKPVYNTITRRLLRRSDSEGRRPPGGPWPEWGAPLGPREPRR